MMIAFLPLSSVFPILPTNPPMFFVDSALPNVIAMFEKLSAGISETANKTEQLF